MRDTREERLVVQTFGDEPGLVECRADRVLTLFEAVESVRQRKCPRLLTPLVIVPERGTEWTARIGGARWHPYVLIVGPFQYARIGDAIERDTARNHQMTRAMACMEPACHMQHHFLDAHLESTCERLVMVADRLVGMSRRSERLEEFMAERFQKRVAVEHEVAHVDLVAPVLGEVDRIAEAADIAVVAVCGERHDRPFLEIPEAEMAGDERVDHAKRVEDLASPETLETIALADVRRRRRVVAVTVHNEDIRLLEG